ncbi:nuclease-related domain-containing protein [Lysobacter enzymogenes]|uniref:nuclease-related domain-containing protein n=1 Tax=Lysobacter enzymogenes TaxID=69 RepID=UPI0019D2EA66|nr:nuclease-related domain-containing protein [Lysobacter enzymogenes]
MKDTSWAGLKAHLDATPGFDAEKLVELVRINESLLFKHGGKGVAARDELLSQLAAYLRAAGQDEHASALDAHTADLALIEAGFAGILKEIDTGPWKAMSGAARVASMLELASRESRYLDALMEKAIVSGEGVANPMIQAPDGRRLDPDVALGALLDLVKNTVMMEAYRGKWFDAQGHVRVPDGPPVEEADVQRMNGYGLLANSWRNWDGAQQKVRFRGARLRPLTEAEVRRLVGERYGEPGVSRYGHVLELDGAREFPDICANERLMDRISNDLRSMVRELSKRTLKQSGDHRLPPETYLSRDEALAVESMAHLLSIDATAAEQVFSGLRMIEWIRGYATIRRRVQRDSDGAQESPFWLRYARADLLAELAACGLSEDKAATFLSHATLHRSSRDLFDQPLIATTGDDLIVVAYALAPSLISQVVLSAIAAKARLDEHETAQVEGKGEGFERRVLDLFRQQGLKACAPTVKHDGQTYQYDALLAWGEFLFVFECKNHTLSSNHPVAAYYFEKECRENIKQVKRLADALQRYPQILEQHLPEGIGKTIVPCVLNALPYASTGERDDVLFADESALSRFFTGSAGLRAGAGGDYLVELRLWQGAAPTALDLLFALLHPFQMHLMADQIESSHAPAWLSPEWMAVCWYFQRTSMTPAEMKAAVEKFEAFRSQWMQAVAAQAEADEAQTQTDSA